MNKLSPRTVKWLTKMINHKRWGRYRYSKVKYQWRVEKFFRMPYTTDKDWYPYKGYDDAGNYDWLPSYNNEKGSIGYIVSARADEIIDYYKWKRKSKQYKKRKWTYLQ